MPDLVFEFGELRDEASRSRAERIWPHDDAIGERGK